MHQESLEDIDQVGTVEGGIIEGGQEEQVGRGGLRGCHPHVVIVVVQSVTMAVMIVVAIMGGDSGGGCGDSGGGCGDSG